MLRTCMLSAAVLLFVEAIAARAVAAEDVKATFLGSMSYTSDTSAADCDKAKEAIAAGKSHEAILDADGVGTGDFHCSFGKVEEREAGRVWSVKTLCDVNKGDPEDSIFEKNAADGSFKVTIEGHNVKEPPLVFVPCSAK